MKELRFRDWQLTPGSAERIIAETSPRCQSIIRQTMASDAIVSERKFTTSSGKAAVVFHGLWLSQLHAPGLDDYRRLA